MECFLGVILATEIQWVPFLAIYSGFIFLEDFSGNISEKVRDFISNFMSYKGITGSPQVNLIIVLSELTLKFLYFYYLFVGFLGFLGVKLMLVQRK